MIEFEKYNYVNLTNKSQIFLEFRKDATQKQESDFKNFFIFTNTQRSIAIKFYLCGRPGFFKVIFCMPVPSFYDF